MHMRAHSLLHIQCVQGAEAITDDLTTLDRKALLQLGYAANPHILQRSTGKSDAVSYWYFYWFDKPFKIICPPKFCSLKFEEMIPTVEVGLRWIVINTPGSALTSTMDWRLVCLLWKSHLPSLEVCKNLVYTVQNVNWPRWQWANPVSPLSPQRSSWIIFLFWKS